MFINDVEALGHPEIARRLAKVAMQMAHSHGVFGADAEDLAQEATVAVITHLRGRGDVRKAEAFIRQTTTFLAYKHRIRRKRQQQLSDEALFGLAAYDSDPAVAAIKREEQNHLAAVVGELPKAERRIIDDFTNGIPLKRTGRKLGMNLNAVWRTRQRTLAKIASKMEGRARE